MCQTTEAFDEYQLENAKLRKRVFDDNLLADDDTKTKYYLYMSFFRLFLAWLSASFQNGPCSVLQQFLMILMKLCLNLGYQDLGYRFGVHYSTVL